MALKSAYSLIRHTNKTNLINCRQVSQFYPIDEYISGLTSEQIQVSDVQSAPIFIFNLPFRLFLVKGNNIQFCSERTGTKSK